jgi:hypothetical protein
MRWKDGCLASPHKDEDGSWARILDLFGTRSSNFAQVQLGPLEATSRPRGDQFGESATQINAALALLGGIAPENELEAALGVQISGVHFLAMELLGRAKQTDRVDHIALYGGLAVKLTRTFAAQVEALAKLRNGGKQTVEVRHVQITNTVIDARKGGGGEHGNGRQPLAPSVEPVECAALPGAFQAVRSALPCTSDPREEDLPHARRA